MKRTREDASLNRDQISSSLPSRGGHFDPLLLLLLDRRTTPRLLDVEDGINNDIRYQRDNRSARRAPDIDTDTTVRTSGEPQNPLDIPREPSARVCEDGGLCVPELKSES